MLVLTIINTILLSTILALMIMKMMEKETSSDIPVTYQEEIKEPEDSKESPDPEKELEKYLPNYKSALENTFKEIAEGEKRNGN